MDGFPLHGRVGGWSTSELTEMLQDFVTRRAMTRSRESDYGRLGDCGDVGLRPHPAVI
jgi:hypothetical protein